MSQTETETVKPQNVQPYIGEFCPYCGHRISEHSSLNEAWRHVERSRKQSVK